MKPVVWHLFAILVHLGGFGLLILGVADSSFLAMPLGNDLLMVALTARRHTHMPYYAAMAAAGSVLGCLLLDAIARKGGEEGLEGRVPRKRLESVKKNVKKRAGWALAIAALMPPPFPFTPFVAGAAALGYPRKRLLAVIGAARLVRFTVEGALAISFGPSILSLAKTPAVEYGVIALVIVSLGGSAYSIWHWSRKGKAKSTVTREKAA